MCSHTCFVSNVYILIHDEDNDEEDNEEIDDFGSLSLNCSIHEYEASANMKTGYSDRFGTVRTINKTIDGIQQSRDFIWATRKCNSERIGTQSQQSHQRNQRRIMKKHKPELFDT